MRVLLAQMYTPFIGIYFFEKFSPFFSLLVKVWLKLSFTSS